MILLRQVLKMYLYVLSGGDYINNHFVSVVMLVHQNFGMMIFW